MTPRPPLFTLPAAVAHAAQISPERPAVVSATGDATYGELEERSARFRAALAALGVGRGDRVAVAAPKSPDTVAALYGVMRAGAAYVPLDPLSPPSRTAAIVADAGCAAMCVDARRSDVLAALGPAAPPVIGLGPDPVDGAAIAATELASVDPDPGIAACEADLAYILYTSGSTGVPKGVMLTHRNALAFVEWVVGRFAVGPTDRLVSHAPLHFDLSVLDLYGAAVAGGAVHLLGPEAGGLGAEMARVVEEQQLTVWYSVPSALVLLAAAARPEQLASLRVVLFAGEVFPVKHLRRLRELVPAAVLANLYGPTETNVCTYHVVPGPEAADLDRPLPIGRSCENQEVMALGDDLRPVADGEVGELWVRGPTVMKGYWGDPVRTAESLRQNPRHDRFPDPAYRTGDLVRRRPDGDYEFLGRRDHQVKSRGYRIELGEIEAALLSHPGVQEAAVVPTPDARIGTALVAVVSLTGGVDPLELRRHCAERLPRYMVPREVRLRDRLPRTSTGKIDRRALAGELDGAATEPAP